MADRPYDAPLPVPGAAASAGRTTVGIVFLVLFLDLIQFGIVFPIYGAMLDHYMQREAENPGLLAAMMGWAAHLVPTSDPNQRAALFGGILGALYSGLQFISAPFWGRLSDRHGRRPVLLVSLVGSFLASLLWVFAADFIILLAARFVAGLFAGNVSTANAAIADITTPENRGRAMALVGMAFGLGFVIGPAIGGMVWSLPWHPDSPSVLGLNPFSAPALVATTLAGVNLAWAAKSFRETLPPERRATGDGGGRTANPFRLFAGDLGPAVPRINLAFTCYTLLFTGMEATLVFLCGDPRRLGWDPFHLGFLFVGMGLTTAATQGLFRALIARAGPRRLGMAGLVLMIPGMICIGVSAWYPHAAILLTGCGILAVSTGLVFPAMSTLISLAADPTRQGWAMGGFRSAGALGRVVGPLVAAYAYFQISPAAPYLIAAAGAVVPIVVLLAVRHGDPISAERTSV
jgi:MFS family permease